MRFKVLLSLGGSAGLLLLFVAWIVMPTLFVKSEIAKKPNNWGFASNLADSREDPAFIEFDDVYPAEWPTEIVFPDNTYLATRPLPGQWTSVHEETWHPTLKCISQGPVESIVEHFKTKIAASGLENYSDNEGEHYDPVADHHITCSRLIWADLWQTQLTDTGSVDSLKGMLRLEIHDYGLRDNWIYYEISAWKDEKVAVEATPQQADQQP